MLYATDWRTLNVSLLFLQGFQKTFHSDCTARLSTEVMIVCELHYQDDGTLHDPHGTFLLIYALDHA